MNLLTRAILASTRLPVLGSKIKRWVQNRFDAAFQGWGERSWLFQSLQDAWLEIDATTRQELQRISDSLAENSPIVDKILDLKVQFSAGAGGLKVIAESSDEGFNDARSISWENWWKKPELGCDISGAQLTRQWARLLPQKGEIFVNLTQEEIIQNGRAVKVPRTQTIDAHRVKSPGGMTKDDRTGFPIIDGEVTTPFGFSSNAGTEEFDRLPAYDCNAPQKGGVIHIFKRTRPGQRRGLPDGVSVFNLVRDNMDLHKLTMQCAKINAEIAQVETNPTGELDALLNRKSKISINTQNSAGAQVTKTGWADYNVSVGGKKIAIKTGSKISDFVTQMPSPATQDYWDLHITFICVGYKVPKMLVMPYSLQGTVTRADLDICTAAFRQDFELLRELCETVYAWQGEWDIKSNLNLSGAKYKNALAQISADNIETRERKARAERSRWVMDAKTPDDAHVCLIRPPRAPNVDIGYTAKALEIELRLGVRVPQDIFADKGQDWRTQTRQMAEYINYVNQLAKEFNLQPGQITSLATQQAIEDPTNRPDNPENPAPGGGESSPEAKLANQVIHA
jgi:Phage portal protein, lambda family